MQSHSLAPLMALSLTTIALAHDHSPPAPNTPASPHADGHNHARPDSHAPLSVMADHTHKKGEWMVSYRRMMMEMDGNRSGTSDTSLTQVLGQFPIAPTRMTMRMDMLGVMHAPSDDVTWALMIPRIFVGMDHINRMGRRFRTEEEGIGDIGLTALINKRRSARRNEHFILGMKFPTGELSPRDATPLGPRSLLPYPMRIGTGSNIFQLGYNRTEVREHGTIGFQALANIPIGRNNHNYEIGDSYQFQLWKQHNVRKRVAVGARLGYTVWDDIDGADSRLNQGLIATARPDLRGGRRLDAGLSVNWVLPRGHRIGLEYALPVHQDLDGPQLETDRVVTLGYQWSW